MCVRRKEPEVHIGEVTFLRRLVTFTSSIMLSGIVAGTFPSTRRKCCVRGPTPPTKIERTSLFKRRGQQGNVYQARQHGKWNPRSSAYGRFWIDVPDGERERRTVSLGMCATQSVARLRLREYIERPGVSSERAFHQIPVPGTTFRQQAEWWMESLSTRRRRPLKPATIYGWQHCLDRWILPNPKYIIRTVIVYRDVYRAPWQLCTSITH